MMESGDVKMLHAAHLYKGLAGSSVTHQSQIQNPREIHFKVALSNYRVYTSDYDQFKSLQNVNLPGEIHVVLAFARDYDYRGVHTKGRFLSYFDTASVTPQVISEFKKNSASRVKFFLSIGGRDQKYPFAVKPAEKLTWIKNATDSLTTIISDYHLDGIDVYYEHIKSDAGGQFVDAIGQVITELKKNEVITVASIAASAPLNDTYYHTLFEKYNKIIDTVVYQCHNEVNPITSVEELVVLLHNLPYLKEKLFAGHSVLPKDWSTVPLPIFLGAIPQLLTKSLVSGISHWTVTSDDPEK